MPLGRVSISLGGGSDRLECGGSSWTGDLASPSFSRGVNSEEYVTAGSGPEYRFERSLFAGHDRVTASLCSGFGLKN